MRFTVFTPTYNRGYIIEVLFQSLLRQTFLDFEWIVIDDGSTDNTEEIISNFKKTNKCFPIIYIKTENGGKHRAINKGVKLAKGELFYIVDSDDYITNDALETIDRYEKTIPENEKHKFAGVCGNKGFVNSDKIIGETFVGEYLDTTTLDRIKYNIFGDKAEVFYTSILKQYPFPEFENENFITECVVWDRIAFDGYMLRFFNKTTMMCEYRQDGLTAQGNRLFIYNPAGWGLHIQQNIKFKGIRSLEKWNIYLNYYYSTRTSISFFKIAKNLNYKPLSLFFRLAFLRLFYRFYDC